jgi:hypothetical protein
MIALIGLGGDWEMDKAQLARSVAAELGGDVESMTDRILETGDSRLLGVSEVVSVASFVVACAQVAIQVWQARQDRALLLEHMLEGAPPSLNLDPERRLGLIGRVVNRLVPDSWTASPSLDLQGRKSKADWLKEWTGTGTRRLSPTVLMPFADMRTFAVYRPIKWEPPSASKGEFEAITVPRGFVTDLASVPEYFWWALPPSGLYGHAAILHDWLYWEQGVPRATADKVFDVAMDEMHVTLPLRKAMWAAVRIYGGGYWEESARGRREGEKRVIQRFPETSAVSWEEWRRDSTVFL